MIPAFLAIIVFMMSGKFSGAMMMFPVSCAASSLFLMAVVIRFAQPSKWMDSLSENAYGIYLLHYFFVIWMQYVVLHGPTPALVKFAVVFVAAVGLSGVTTGVLRRSKMIARVV
jgi:surface polysaccharide O-acyltransferase-like enzyme